MVTPKFQSPATTRAQVPVRRGGSVDDLTQDMATVLSGPMVNGALVRDVTVTTGLTTVPHGLNRTPLSWVVCRTRDSAGVVAEWGGKPPDDRNIYITASSGVVVDLWVFG